ncbi:MAG: HlyC/CorC family transporter [Acidobacteria bacterium]|nr:HlyC/CorC family transporter [Acidobacteriota bacterium]MBI3278523.1 HlyC/CorC family transporter [Acidobacteriota bacterium]
MSESYYGYRFLLLAFILALNAFFAAAEVALISSRKSRLKQLASEDNVGAQAALSLLQNPERLLSVVQVGVTLSSLGLGWAGEATLFALVTSALHPVLTPATATVLHGVSFALSFAIMTFAHVVLGEVVPKNLALEKADRLAVLVAPALLVFYRITEPFVFVIERSASAVSRLLGLRGEPHGGGHSAEELKFIVASSRTEGHLESFEEDAIGRLLDAHHYVTREIMVPRHAMISVPLEATLEQVLHVFSEHQYSRLPVYQRSPENIVGVLHFKDLMPAWEEGRRAMERGRPVRAFRLHLLMRKAVVVPETKPVNQLLDEFRRNHTHMAMVVDEFGTISGLVTLEDVLEQIFGEIEDEHDERRARPALGADVLDLEGATSIRDLETQYGIVLPTEAGFETLAGFLLYQFGTIPEAGDSVKHDTRRFTVLEMERNRIAKVRIEMTS